MKKKVKKVAIVLFALAWFLDWPVSIDAVNGKAVNGVARGFMKGCSKSSKADETVIKSLRKTDNSVSNGVYPAAYQGSKAVGQYTDEQE